MDSKFDADSDGTFRITRKTIFDMNTEKRKPHKLEFSAIITVILKFL